MTNTEPRRAQCAAEPERYKHSTIYKIVSGETEILENLYLLNILLYIYTTIDRDVLYTI